MRDFKIGDVVIVKKDPDEYVGKEWVGRKGTVIDVEAEGSTFPYRVTFENRKDLKVVKLDDNWFMASELKEIPRYVGDWKRRLLSR